MKKDLLTLALFIAAASAADAQASYSEALEMQVGQNSATIESELSDTAFFKYTAPEGVALRVAPNSGTAITVRELVAGGDTATLSSIYISGSESAYPVIGGHTVYVCAIGVGEVGFTASTETLAGVGTGSSADDPLTIVPGTRQFVGNTYQGMGYSFTIYATYTATESGALVFTSTGSLAVSVNGGPSSYMDYNMGTYTYSLTATEGQTYSLVFTGYSPALLSTEMTHPEPGSPEMPFEMAEGDNTVPAAYGEYWYTYTPTTTGYAAITADNYLPGGQVKVYNNASAIQYGQVYAQSETGSYNVRFEVPYAGNTYHVCVTKNETTAAEETFSLAMEPYKAGDQENNPITISELPAAMATENAGGTTYYAVSVAAGDAKFLSVNVKTRLASTATQVSIYPQGNQYVGVSANGSVRAEVSGGQYGQTYIIRISSYESTPIEFDVAFEEIAQGDVITNPLPAAIGDNAVSGQGTRYYSYTATVTGKLSVTGTATMSVIFPRGTDQWAGNYQATVSGVTYTIDCVAATTYLIRIDNAQDGDVFTLAEREYQAGEGRDNPITVDGNAYTLGAEVASDLWIKYTATRSGVLVIESDVPYDPASGIYYCHDDEPYTQPMATSSGENTVYRAQTIVDGGEAILVNLKLSSPNEGRKVTFTERDFEAGESFGKPLELTVNAATDIPQASRTTPIWLKVTLGEGEATIRPNGYMMAKLYASKEEAEADAASYISWYTSYDEYYNTSYYYTWTVGRQTEYYIKVEQNTAPASITVEGTEPTAEPQPGESIDLALELSANGSTTVPQATEGAPVWCKVTLAKGTASITATENATAVWYAGKAEAEAGDGSQMAFEAATGAGSQPAYTCTYDITAGGEYYIKVESSEAPVTFTIENKEDDASSMSAATAAEARAVSISGRTVTVTAANANVGIYGLAGTRVAGGKVDGAASFDLKPGIYIMDVNGKATKIHIK